MGPSNPSFSFHTAFAERSREGGRCSGYARGPGKTLSGPASVDGLFHPSLATAFLTRSRIDFAARLHWLRQHGIASAIARRTFRLARLRARLNTRSPFYFSVPQFASGDEEWHLIGGIEPLCV